MYKNQLQELAQRSCFNLPSYSCIREGPDHAPRFKAKVNFNGETFESPNFFSTLRQAEHASAEVALKTLSQRGPSRALAARVLDETGVYKNLLQETAHRAGLNLPVYTTVRSGPGGAPLFACTVELAGMSFKGEPAKTKKQAQKSAAMAAWFSLKNLSLQDSSESTSSDGGGKDEQEQITVARYLAKFKLPERRKPLKAPVKNDVIPYHVNRRSDHQNYTYFPLSPYQNWHHGMTLLTSPSAPPSISGPQFFPFVQSIFQSGIGPPYIFPTEREPLPLPFFYVAGDLVPSCTRGSRVRIEEIEENSQVEEEWRLNTNTNSRAQTDDFSWLPHGFLRNNHGGLVPPWRSSTTTPQSTMGPTRFPPETSQVNRNATSRTGRFYSRPSWSTVPSCSSRVPFARTMAPAVQIRSVVPVCSAPAQRGPPLGQEASSSNGSEASKGISAPCSEFSRLQM